MTSKYEIKKLAYKIYVKSGKKEGRTLYNWLKAETIILWRNRFINFLRFPLVMIIVSGLIIWFIQQGYLQNQEKLRIKFEVVKSVLPIYTSYYQEIWNEWYAFQNKQPSVEYRRNIQLTIEKSKAIQVQMPILFRDKKIYEDWKEILHIFWEAQYPISRQGISEQQLNEKLNLINPLLDDLLNRMHREVK